MAWIQEHITPLLTTDIRPRVLYKHELNSNAYCACDSGVHDHWT